MEESWGVSGEWSGREAVAPDVVDEDCGRY